MDRKELEEIWKTKAETGADGRILLKQMLERKSNYETKLAALKSETEGLVVTSWFYFGKRSNTTVEEETGHKESSLIPLGELDTVDSIGRDHGFATAFVDYVVDVRPVEHKGRLFKTIDYEPVVTSTISNVGLVFWAGKEDSSELSFVTAAVIEPQHLLFRDESLINDFDSSLQLIRTNLLQQIPLE